MILSIVYIQRFLQTRFPKVASGLSLRTLRATTANRAKFETVCGTNELAWIEELYLFLSGFRKPHLLLQILEVTKCATLGYLP